MPFTVLANFSVRRLHGWVSRCKLTTSMTLPYQPDLPNILRETLKKMGRPGYKAKSVCYLMLQKALKGYQWHQTVKVMKYWRFVACKHLVQPQRLQTYHLCWLCLLTRPTIGQYWHYSICKEEDSMQAVVCILRAEVLVLKIIIAIAWSCFLLNFSLDGNPVGDEGAEALAGAMKTMTNLQILW